MEIDRATESAVSVLRCDEALRQLQPGEELTLTVCDPGVVNNIILLINSQPESSLQTMSGSRIVSGPPDGQ